MAFRSIATNSVENTDLVVTKPAGVVSGDILIAFAVNDAGSLTFTWPLGFTDVPSTPITCTADGQTLGVAVKTAGDSEPATYTISTTVSNIIGGIVAFSGCVATQPYRSSIGDDDTAGASPWSLITAAFASSTGVACDLVFIGGSDTTSSVNAVHSGPSGYTVQADLNSGFRNVMCSTLDNVAAGETGAQTATGTFGGASAGDGCVALALELTAAAGGIPSLLLAPIIST